MALLVILLSEYANGLLSYECASPRMASVRMKTRIGVRTITKDYALNYSYPDDSTRILVREHLDRQRNREYQLVQCCAANDRVIISTVFQHSAPKKHIDITRWTNFKSHRLSLVHDKLKKVSS